MPGVARAGSDKPRIDVHRHHRMAEAGQVDGMATIAAGQVQYRPSGRDQARPAHHPGRRRHCPATPAMAPAPTCMAFIHNCSIRGGR
jgi:hypothetical protein